MQAHATALAPEEQLFQAINRNYTFRLSFFNDALDVTRTNMKLERIMFSRKPAALNLTIFTQLTVDRLDILRAQCTSWKGPLSAAAYFGVLQDPNSSPNARTELLPEQVVRIKEMVAQVEAFHAEMEQQASACQLSLMFFWEAFGNEKAKLLYPVNFLRNYARLAVHTPLLAMVDVDLVMSTSLSAALSDPKRYALLEQWTQKQVAFVLPAFEPVPSDNKEAAIAAVPASKAQMAAMWRSHLVRQFKKVHFPKGHQCTSYRLWMNATRPYLVDYQSEYEPWFISHRDWLPWFDVRFRGYGYNKIMHVTDVVHRGFKLAVLADAWIVHMPHEDTGARALMRRDMVAGPTNKLPRNSLFRAVKLMYLRSRGRMRRGEYRTPLDDRFVDVLGSVPWLHDPVHARVLTPAAAS